MSGMKKSDAKKAVEAKIKKYQEQSISLRIEEENVQVTLGELGFTIKDVDKLVEKALAYGKGGSIWSRYFEVKKLDKEKHIRLTARRQKQFLKQRHSHWKKRQQMRRLLVRTAHLSLQMKFRERRLMQKPQ